MPTLYGASWAFDLIKKGALVDEREAMTNQRKADLALRSTMPAPSPEIKKILDDRKIDEALAAAPPPDPMTFGGPVTPDPAAPSNPPVVDPPLPPKPVVGPDGLLHPADEVIPPDGPVLP